MKTLAEAWASFEQALPRSASARARRSIQLAFYGGASFAFELLTGTGQAAPLPDDENEADARIGGIDTEIRKFTAEVAAEIAKARES